MALEAIEARLRDLEDRMMHLEAGQGQVVTEAKAAAGIAATGLTPPELIATCHVRNRHRC